MYTCPYCNQPSDKVKLSKVTLQPISCLKCWRNRIFSVEDYQRFVDLKEMREIDNSRLEANKLIKYPISVERLSKRKVRSDKGVKRNQYVKNKRLIKEQAKSLERIQKDINKFQRIEIKDSNKLSRNERAKQKRLQLIPNPRICPHCNKTKLLSKQWVIRNDYIGCKSCFWIKNILPNKELNNGVLASNSDKTLGNDTE